MLSNTFGETTMIETTTQEKAPILAADLAMIAQNAVKEKAPQNAVIIEAKPLVARDYIDPVDEQYKLEKKNKLGTIEHRESVEGVKSLHAFFLSAGDMPEL